MVLAFILAVVSGICFGLTFLAPEPYPGRLTNIGLSLFAFAFAAFVLFGSHQFDIKTF